MKYTNALNLPEPYYKACVGDEEYHFTPHRYSVTTLQKGACRVYLDRTFGDNVEEDVADMFSVLFGKAIHEFLQKHAEEGNAEQRIEVSLKDRKGRGITLSGIYDLWDEEDMITDYKTCTTWKVKFGDWEDYKWQLVGYSCLAELSGKKAPSKGRILALQKDWTKAEFRRHPTDYPIHGSAVVIFNITELMRKAWLDEVLDKVTEIEDALESSRMPQRCSASERYEQPTKYALKKKKEDAKAIKLFDSLDAALNYQKGGKWVGSVVEVRKGISKMCLDYCHVAQMCPYYHEENDNTEYEYIKCSHKDGDTVDEA